MSNSKINFNNILNLIINPKKLYKNLIISPKVVFPISIIIILNVFNILLSQKVTTYYYSDDIAYQLAEVVGDTSVINNYMQSIEHIDNNNIFTSLYFFMISTTFKILINLFICASVVFLLAKLAMSEGTFKQIFSVICYNNIILQLFSIVSTFFMIILNTNNNIFAFSTLLIPNGNIFNIKVVILTSVTIPSIYHLILNIIGIKEVTKFDSLKKPIIISLFVYIFPIIMSVISTLLTITVYTNI